MFIKQNKLTLLLTAILLSFSFLSFDVLASEESSNSETAIEKECQLADQIKDILGPELDGSIIYKGETIGITEGIIKVGACDDNFTNLIKINAENYLLEMGETQPKQFILSLMPSKSYVSDLKADVTDLISQVDLPQSFIDAGILDDLDIEANFEVNADIPDQVDVNARIDSNIPERIEIVTPNDFTIDSNIPDKITVEAELSDTTIGIYVVTLISVFILSGTALVVSLRKK